MSSDVEISDYEEPPSSPECVDPGSGVPRLHVDVISGNNARYCDKESASGSHFYTEPS